MTEDTITYEDVSEFGNSLVCLVKDIADFLLQQSTRYHATSTPLGEVNQLSADAGKLKEELESWEYEFSVGNLLWENLSGLQRWKARARELSTRFADLRIALTRDTNDNIATLDNETHTQASNVGTSFVYECPTPQPVPYSPSNDIGSPMSVYQSPKWNVGDPVPTPGLYPPSPYNQSEAENENGNSDLSKIAANAEIGNAKTPEERLAEAEELIHTLFGELARKDAVIARLDCDLRRAKQGQSLPRSPGVLISQFNNDTEAAQTSEPASSSRPMSGRIGLSIMLAPRTSIETAGHHEPTSGESSHSGRGRSHHRRSLPLLESQSDVTMSSPRTNIEFAEENQLTSVNSPSAGPAVPPRHRSISLSELQERDARMLDANTSIQSNSDDASTPAAAPTSNSANVLAMPAAPASASNPPPASQMSAARRKIHSLISRLHEDQVQSYERAFKEAVKFGEQPSLNHHWVTGHWRITRRSRS